MAHWKRVHSVGVVAILSVAMYLVAHGAHFFEMFSKFGLSARDYMVVQRIYDGWALFGIVMISALASILGYTILTWDALQSRRLSLLAFGALAATQAIFWIVVQPMNVLTNNWTTMPDNLEAARRQWEYGHAFSAGLTLLALIAISLAVVGNAARGDDGHMQSRAM